jgi:hypothetical protein
VAHRHAGDVVDVLRGEAVLEHLVDGRHHRVRADAVADEVRRVLADHDALAEHVLAELLDARDRLGRRVGPGHELEELHVADRVEEVHHEEALLERLAAALQHVAMRRPEVFEATIVVRGDELLELRRRAPASARALDDRLDDEVAVAHLLEVVLRVADRTEARTRRGRTLPGAT